MKVCTLVWLISLAILLGAVRLVSTRHSAASTGCPLHGGECVHTNSLVAWHCARSSYSCALCQRKLIPEIPRVLSIALGWHSFRRTFATLLKRGGEDVKTVQELMRHANSRLTLDVYAQALTPAKRAAHLKLVGLIHPAAETAIGPSWSRAEAAVAVSS
jgi:integrase-like protein